MYTSIYILIYILVYCVRERERCVHSPMSHTVNDNIFGVVVSVTILVVDFALIIKQLN